MSKLQENTFTTIEFTNVYLYIGGLLFITFAIFSIAEWKTHWDYKQQDLLIRQQQMDPVQEKITDTLTLEDW